MGASEMKPLWLQLYEKVETEAQRRIAELGCVKSDKLRKTKTKP